MRDFLDRWHGPRHETYVKRCVVLLFILPLVLAYVLAFASGVQGTNGRFNVFFSLPTENEALYLVANLLVVFAGVMVVLLFVDAAVHVRRNKR
jgi:membrane glycosyltransferase